MAKLSALESAIASLQGRSVQDPGKIYGGLLPFSRVDAEKLSGPETEGPLPGLTLDAAAGISGMGLDAATGILNLLKGGGGGFDRNDPQSSKTIAKSALDLFGGSQLLRKGPVDLNTLGMYLGPKGIKRTLTPGGVKRAARELENAPEEGGLLRLNQGLNQSTGVVVHRAPPELQQYAKRNVNEELRDTEAQRNARLLDNLSGSETDAADLQTLAQQKKISEQLPASKIVAEISDESALFSKKATRSIDEFLERADPVGEVALMKKAGYKISLSPEEEASRVTTLGEMMGHPQLFEIYPELMNLKVRFVDLPTNIFGAYNPSTKAIEIDPYRIRQARDSLGPESKNLYSTETNEDVMGVVLHEVQHAVQDLDPISPNLMSSAGDLTGGSSPKAFKLAKQSVPKYVLENKNFVDRFFGDELYDPFKNYRESSGEVFARSTEDRRLQSLLERLQNSDPKKMLEDVGATRIATERRETPIGQVTTRIWQAEQKGLISPGMEPEKLDSILNKILDDVGEQFGPEKVEKFRKGGEVPIPRTVDDHFLSYINPQEASALRAMGGGITASGGQRMMNGIPSFQNTGASTSEHPGGAPASSPGGTASNTTDMPDDVDDPHGKDQPTSQNPLGGVPGVDDTQTDKYDREHKEARHKQTRDVAKAKEKADKDLAAAIAAAKQARNSINFTVSLMNPTRASLIADPLGTFGDLFGGLPGKSPDPDDPNAGFGDEGTQFKKKGGEVKVPEKVSGHFLAYINPQEAAMLRGAGGGITALGGQKMKNGIPIFDPNDPEGVGGSAAAETAAASASAAAAASAQAAAEETAAVAQGPSSAPSLSKTDFVGVTGPVSGIVGLVTDPLGTFGKLSGIPDAVVDAVKAASAVGTIAGGLVSMPWSGPIGPFMAMNSLVGLARDYGLDVDDDTSNPDTEGMFGQ